jgi:carbon-monoxide dehydrogenase small subunit
MSRGRGSSATARPKPRRRADVNGKVKASAEVLIPRPPATSAPRARKPTPMAALECTVNGARRRVRVPPMKRLLDVLREDLALPGTKEGCGEGECGACTVLLDGLSVCSCLVPAMQAHGKKIVTVEGLAPGPRLTALQQAFLELGGAQCGICTPGMLITSVELLRRARGRVPSDDEIREALAGNLCRCTGYQKIVDAVRRAARAPKDGRP